MEEKLLDFDKDIEILAKSVDWIEDPEARKKYVISFCSGKVNS